jgi:hypothetical protein
VRDEVGFLALHQGFADRFFVGLAKTSDHGQDRRTYLPGGATYVSSHHWTQLFSAGVVSPSLPAAFAVPAAYGDFVTGIFAIAATLALARRAPWAFLLVWVFNVWGAADLLNAFYQGNVHIVDPGALGAAFYIPTAVAPPLLVTHALIFWVLLRAKAS